MIYDKSIPHMCLYCEYSRRGLGESLVCPYKGAVTENYRCHRYRYDVTKRIPRRRPELIPLIDNPKVFEI